MYKDKIITHVLSSIHKENAKSIVVFNIGN